MLEARHESWVHVSTIVHTWSDEKSTYGIANTPHGDADALDLVEAGVERIRVVCRRGLDNVELRDGDLGDTRGGEGVQGCRGLRREAGSEMSLRACARQ